MRGESLRKTKDEESKFNISPEDLPGLQLLSDQEDSSARHGSYIVMLFEASLESL